MNQLTMNQRLKILIEHLGFTSVRSFAKHIGEDYPDTVTDFCGNYKKARYTMDC